MLLAAVVAALALAACGKKDSGTESGITDIVAEIPYVSNFTCDYYAGEGFADYVARSTAFGSEDEVLIRLSFTLSPKAFKRGKRRLTIKPILPEGFVGSIVSANTSSVNNTDLTATFNADDRKSKNCEIELKTKFNHSNGELQIGYSYDGEEYQASGSYALSCDQPLNFTYDAETDGYIISRDSVNKGWLAGVEYVEIPDMFAGKPVTGIASGLFQGCSNLTDIEIPDMVTRIGSYVFSCCSGLTSITIPYGVTNISDFTFSGCSSLKSITIPDSVTSIGSDAFKDCSRLTSITIPDGVTSIGYYAFKGCSSLTSITIPDSVTSIGVCAFYDCDKLKCNEYGNAKYLGNEKTPYYWLIRSINNDITSIEISGTTKVICGGAFYGCGSLTNIVIPDSVTSIGSEAFNDCSSLTNIVIPDSVTSIGDAAFFNCGSLTSITIPDGVISVGYSVFSGCDNLQYNEYGNAKYLGNKQNPYFVLIDLIDKTVESVDINPDTKIIYSKAISDCENLKDIMIPDSVTSIGDHVFYWCSSLTSISLPETLTSIGVGVFTDCDSLTSIIFGGTKKQWLSIDADVGEEVADGNVTIECADGKFKYRFYER